MIIVGSNRFDRADELLEAGAASGDADAGEINYSRTDSDLRRRSWIFRAALPGTRRCFCSGAPEPLAGTRGTAPLCTARGAPERSCGGIEFLIPGALRHFVTFC